MTKCLNFAPPEETEKRIHNAAKDTTHTHTHTHTKNRDATQCLTFALLSDIEGNAQENEGHAHLSRTSVQDRRRASNQGTLDLSRHKSRSVCPQQPGTQILYQKT